MSVTPITTHGRKWRYSTSIVRGDMSQTVSNMATVTVNNQQAIEIAYH